MKLQVLKKRLGSQTLVDGFLHTQRRLKERYFLELLPEDYLELNKKIKGVRGKGLTVAHSLRKVQFKNRTVQFVYNRSKKIIITALPYDAKTKKSTGKAPKDHPNI